MEWVIEMNEMYYKAKMAWGVCLPKPLKRLQNRDDEHVFEALKDVLRDVTSDTWTTDARIAWSIMQGREEVG